MNFNKHSEIEGQHAFLSASKHYWINYDTEKVSQAYLNFLATQRGTELHDFACRCIQLRQNLPKARKTLNMYVNDAIGYKMTPEHHRLQDDPGAAFIFLGELFRHCGQHCLPPRLPEDP